MADKYVWMYEESTNCSLLPTDGTHRLCYQTTDKTLWKCADSGWVKVENEITSDEVKSKLESLTGENRLDASAIKNIPDPDLSAYAALDSSPTFTGSVSASNLSGTNTGDQDLSDYARLTDTAQDITANSFVTDGGTSAQFIKGDGSLDSNTYLTTTRGAYETGKTNATVYQAPSDGFVYFYVSNTGSYGYIDIYTDANNPPTTKIGEPYHTSSNGNFVTMFPVKNGDYYKIVKSSAGASIYNYYFIPR